ncbi:oligosaccharide repeat unit polymerase [Bacillus dakarensis]|uniref:oligosaccharide repeat unit polymerase n=1 Tax=Robertmurraya dakarensis TaxID=1926278 RepID=UPI000980A1F5|nr:oligosaccharide repeat unit polymerase [Bacillus dakarensis]
MKNFIQKINRIDTFSPYFFLPFVLVLYFFISLFDFSRFEYFDVNRNVFLAVLLGLAAYYAAVYITDKKQWTFPSFGLGFLRGKTIWFLYLLGAIGLVAYLIMLFTGQVGILDESVRRNLDPKLNFLSSFLWFSVIFLLCHQILKEKELTTKKKLTYGGILMVVFVLFILMGYRTPIMVMFFTSFIVFHYIIKRIKLTWFLSVLVILGILFSLFGFIRIISEDPTEKHNSREGPDVELTEEDLDENLKIQRKINATPKWVRALNSEMVTGHIVLSKLIEYTDEHGYMYGRLHSGIFTTVLPGEQLSPRMQVTEMVNSLSVDEGKYITRPGRTTTPTYLGQLYVEAGYIAIIIGFALYGLIIGMLYNQVQRTGIKSYQTVGYAFVTTIFVLSLHTGLLDLVFLLMIAYAIVSTSIEKKPLQNT